MTGGEKRGRDEGLREGEGKQGESEKESSKWRAGGSEGAKGGEGEDARGARKGRREGGREGARGEREGAPHTQLAPPYFLLVVYHPHVGQGRREQYSIKRTARRFVISVSSFGDLASGIEAGIQMARRRSTTGIRCGGRYPAPLAASGNMAIRLAILLSVACGILPVAGPPSSAKSSNIKAEPDMIDQLLESLSVSGCNRLGKLARAALTPPSECGVLVGVPSHFAFIIMKS